MVCFYQMVDLVFFLIILMVFVLSYSISTYAIMFPNSVLRLSLIRQILRKGYWTLYGELFLEEYEGNTESSETRPPPMVSTYIVSHILFLKLKLMTMKLKYIYWWNVLYWSSDIIDINILHIVFIFSIKVCKKKTNDKRKRLSYFKIESGIFNDV